MNGLVKFYQKEPFLSLFVALLFLVPLTRADVKWLEDFEGPTPNWNVESGVWETGFPTSGPNEAHSGERLAGTVLASNYAGQGADSRLISPAFVVPAADQNPRLR